MSRKTKTAVFAGLLVISVIAIAVLAIQMINLYFGASKADPAAMTSGWVQIVIAGIGALVGGGGSFWQVALGALEKYGAGAVQKFAPNVSTKTAKNLVDMVKLTTYEQLIAKCTDPTAQIKLTEAARGEFDTLRDSLFPLPPPLVQLIPQTVPSQATPVVTPVITPVGPTSAT